MRTSEHIDQLVAAIAKARPYFDAILKTEDNPFYKSKYADLATYINAVAEPLAETGVILTGGPEPMENEAWLIVSSRVCHSSGQWMECSMPIKRSEKPQEMGSGITYARRYTLGALLGLASDDDDGNAASQVIGGSKAKRVDTSGADSQDPADHHPTAEQVTSLMELAASAGCTSLQFGDGLRRLMDLPADTKITKKFLREQMTMSQYEAAWAEYAQRLKVEIESEGDVPDGVVPAPETQATPEASPEQAVDSDRAPEGTPAPQDAERRQWSHLMARAEAVGVRQAAWKDLCAGPYAEALQVIEALEAEATRKEG